MDRVCNIYLSQKFDLHPMYENSMHEILENEIVIKHILFNLLVVLQVVGLILVGCWITYFPTIILQTNAPMLMHY
jgi:hypothetical protein